MRCGFEIKADNDDLSRLRAQARAARPRFRRLVLVVGRRHFEKAVDQVPGWWGVWLASPDLDSPTGVMLTAEREGVVEAEILNALAVRRCDAAEPKHQERVPPRQLISAGMRSLA